MKEVIAVIRRHKVEETKAALLGLGYTSMTINSVDGRGRQKGIGGMACELDPELFDLIQKTAKPAAPGLSFIPKRMLTLAVEDKCAARVVQAIISVNQSNHIGDGKIFVCPIEDAVRVRTNERGDSALL
ncbi:MAG: P-II family nitrogen regulator [Candidatus Schekmanbacteria bacterium]|nr:P-II family nitrogen regulator [Candidatus Schekmanbacteria bacterium]